MQVAGKLVVINATQVVSEKFSKRTFVVQTLEEKYPQEIEFQLTQDKCDYLDHYKVGEQVNVSLNIRGRKWDSPSGETKYFNTLEAWKIERVGAIAQGSTPPPVSTIQAKKIVANIEEEDDLPF